MRIGIKAILILDYRNQLVQHNLVTAHDINPSK